MKLSEWLKRNAVPRSSFARRIGVTPGAVTQMCAPAAWVSRDTAELILRETNGGVTPNDFLSHLFPAAPDGAKTMSDQTAVMEAIDAIARGEIVVVTDDDDRENEGDLIIAAQHCTTEKMAFIIRNGCGIVCVPDDGRRSASPAPVPHGGGQ